MLESIRALTGADGALLLSCHHDDVAVVVDSSPPAMIAGTLRIPYELLRNGSGLVLTDALPARLLSSAYTNWLPLRVTDSALVFERADSASVSPVDASPDGVVSALLLVWCDGNHTTFAATAGTQLPALRALASLILAPDVARRSCERAAERLAAIMRSAPHGIVFVSAHGAAAFVNREAARLLSIPEGTVSAVQLAGAMQCVHERLEHRHRIETEYARLVRERQAELRDWDWEFSGAAQEVWRVSTVPVSETPSDGRLWTIEDVTVERATRRELAKHDAREREVTGQQLEAVRALAAGVAHDFSSILTVIGGSAELMQKARSASEGEAELAVVRRAAKHGQVLVGQLLSFAGQQPSLPTRVPIDDALRALRAPLQALVHELVDKRCALELALDAAGAKVVIDERQLSLALLSLVATASTALASEFASGTATSQVDRVVDVSTGESGRSSRLPRPLVLRSARGEPTLNVGDARSVESETLAGTPAVAIRLDFPALTNPPSDGVGDAADLSDRRDEDAIATTAALLAPFGGRVRRHTNDDGGHTVMLLLPEALASGASLQITPALGSAIVHRESRLPILVVDDDVGPRRVIRRLLEREGYDVLTASSGDEAMQHVVACDGALSAVVSDYLMPGITGMELLTRLRTRWPRLPVVLVSGFASETVTEASMLQLRSHFLPKPFTRDELIGALETASSVLASA